MDTEKINIWDLEQDLNSVPNTKSKFSDIHKETFIDVNADLDKPPAILSIGEVNYGQNRFDRIFGSLGEFSCISGSSKSRKTFFKSLLVASYIGGSANNYAGNIKSHRAEDKYILDIDTEQGAWYAQRTFKRVSKLTNYNFVHGHEYEYYKPFQLRKLDYKERLEFIEYLVFESEYRNKIGLICVDGFADLVAEVNDLNSCNELVKKMMQWTDKGNCHLTGILHKNFGSEKKPTGHLGSAILKKAETVCIMDINDTDPAYTDVSFPYTRGFPIEPFRFYINDYGLPVVE